MTRALAPMTAERMALRHGEIGMRYLSRYWGEEFDVLAYDLDSEMVTVRWVNDGRITTHCTLRDRRDELVGPTPTQ